MVALLLEYYTVGRNFTSHTFHPVLQSTFPPAPPSRLLPTPRNIILPSPHVNSSFPSPYHVNSLLSTFHTAPSPSSCPLASHLTFLHFPSPNPPPFATSYFTLMLPSISISRPSYFPASVSLFISFLSCTLSPFLLHKRFFPSHLFMQTPLLYSAPSPRPHFPLLKPPLPPHFPFHEP